MQAFSNTITTIDIDLEGSWQLIPYHFPHTPSENDPKLE